MRGDRIKLTVAPDVGAALLHSFYAQQRRSFYGMRDIQTGTIVPEAEFYVTRCDLIGNLDTPIGCEVELYDPGPDAWPVLDVRNAIRETRRAAE